VVEASVSWNYTTWLNIAFFVLKLKWDKSNPTGHGVVFLSRAGYVFCYVQLGGV
jgi:hypothetical protein